MNFGFVLPNTRGPDEPEDVIDLAVRAEELGFGYIRDRLDDRRYYDSITILTWAAAVTARTGGRSLAPW